MRKEILERYRHDAAGRRIIDISAARVADLYEDFDKQAPFIKKDLDYDLVEYLVESVRELGREPFSVNFSFEHALDEKLKERVCHSIAGYFDYLLARNARELHVMARTSLTLFVLGFAMLAISFWIPESAIEDSMVEQVATEGLVIAAWVSMWEAIAGVLLNWQPTVRERLVYRRLKAAPLTFVHAPRQESPVSPS